jgi:hypothetical protein
MSRARYRAADRWRPVPMNGIVGTFFEEAGGVLL